ncbi:MAG: PspA/IM30 family protein [Synechococcus sp. SB0662_bin_45]|nr:PspA/IM30 family protein [Cyanobacteria bacterium MAG IRC4_bin_6]MXW12403.1 PspA/IM30 family protein [Synechococcus sp. SB0668_bin_13]MYE22265.1 PspA/IM30 family protein [Synechococcus sp. SB0662_bin_45]MYK06130.1 PspA/IM30 family protein [Synechococcus sp. SB0670_bin_20]
MSFFSRLWRLMRANTNDLMSRAEDPAKILDQSLMDMQAELVKLRQAVATAVASQKRIERQASQARVQADHWYGRAQLALKGGDEDLARQALSQRKTHEETAQALSRQLESQAGQVDVLKRSLLKLEGQIAQAKTRKDTLKARAQAAQAQKQLEGAVSGISTDSAMAAFERMEEKVESLEAETAAIGELAGDNLEARFEAMEGSDVDDELAALKASSMAPAPALPVLPDSNTTANPRQEVQVEQVQVDDELAALRRSMNLPPQLNP